MKQKENKTKARINEFKESVDERKEDEIWRINNRTEWKECVNEREEKRNVDL
jgi:hypothetical protein